MLSQTFRSTTILALTLPISLTRATSRCPDLSWPPTESTVQEFLDSSFDYLIVGGGTAGVAFASRIAAESSLVVGVLEAGQYHLDDPIVDIPGFVGRGAGNPDYDWGFRTAPQENTDGRVLALTRGKMLGGSSGVNGMAWGRASAAEYDSWDIFATGTTSEAISWTWDSMFKSFKRSETVFSVPENPYPGISELEALASALTLPLVSGLGGPIKATYNSFYPDPVSVVARTLNKMGFPTNPQPQGGNAAGVVNTLTSIDRKLGVRSYAPRAYLCEQNARPNLKVLLGAQATKVLFHNVSSASFTASGVEFYLESLNKTFSVRAKKDIVLSAGTIQTPQLLELSGIGNKDLLDSLGIETMIDLPGVGENLQEHLYAGVQWKLRPNVSTFDALNNATIANDALRQYNTTHTGLYTAIDSTTAYFPLHSLVSPSRLPSLLSIFDGLKAQTPLAKIAYPVQRGWYTDAHAQGVSTVEVLQWSKGLFDVQPGGSYAFMLGGLAHPASRGSVHINVSDPLAHPIVDPKFLSQDFDAQILLDALKFVQQVGHTAPFSDLIIAQTNPDPGAQSDEELLHPLHVCSAYMHVHTFDTVSLSRSKGGDHLIGTAALGPRESGGVVDAGLKVYGTTNLRVVDASVIPIHIAAHTQATVYAIAEKAAADILRQQSL